MATQETLTQHTTNNIGQLYDKYAGMLLGYFYETVKDHKLAEQYLIAVFKEVPQYLHDINDARHNTWLQLQRLAKKQLAGFVAGVKREFKGTLLTEGKQLKSGNSLLTLMNAAQQHVFYEVYYHQKPVATLAKEMDLTVDAIRRLLKEAFSLMRGKAWKI